MSGEDDASVLGCPRVYAARLEANTPEAVIRALAARLETAGHVRSTFEAAAIAREKRSPTGLPFPGTGVAIPHADPEHVARPAIAIATLAAPVRFREMGSPGESVLVQIVVMPAISEKQQAAAGLTSIIELLQHEELRAALIEAESQDALKDAVDRFSRETR